MASGTDRISALPDEALHLVLSFLPAHEVVSTALLARRWRHLWKSAPALRVTGVKDCDNPGWFIQYVDSLLLFRHSGALLDSFNLDLDECDFGFKPFLPTYNMNVNLWFRLALFCQARVLSLRTTHGIYKYEDNRPLQLPSVPIISQHLKRLDLELVCLKGSTLDFSGCPALVDLKMKTCEILGDLKSPFLKQLSISGCYFAYGSSRTRIYLPGLVSLVLSDFGRRTPLLNNMPLLVSAIVRVTDRCVDDCPKSSYGDCEDPTCFGCHNSYEGADDGRGESILLKGLSQVMELELSVDSKVFIVNRDLKLHPTFCKLKMLLLSEWCPGVSASLNVLTCFLQYSPILEKLTLQLSKVPKDRVETERTCEPSEKSFACGHLKIVEIKCEEVDGRVHKVLDILCTYGIPLEKVNIQQTNRASGP
ncbi:MEIOTIC F-BOX protein MOF-like [Phragmites australis]|uniref:MEIOTIC F-BOX protein MOF-like n=1 Tax=Phragmites australis TaxID=29695 RepID=UPI002D79A1F8|nr:MEIOTIC F-BOX protein MOF-like [Phragmites australis]XP_062196986.1 MEIOTIC F-BOX protein MOF-like [Phragmites australis]